MATQATGGGSTVSFGNTPQANNDIFSFTEDAANILVLNVMANDLGGAAKTLFSLDDGTSASASTKSYAPADLLVKDVTYSNDAAGAAGTSDHSALGARIWIESDGTVHYDKGDINAKLQALGVGEALTDTFTYAIQLGNGTLSWATVTLQFTGLNDAPTIVLGSTTANGAFSEAANTTGSSTSDQATGTIVFSDIDAHDTHAVSKAGPSFAWASGALTSAQTAALTAASNLNLVTTDSTNSATAMGSVKWTYSAADKAFDFLAAGETLTVTYTVTIDDGHGGVVSQPVTVTVTGTNDMPTIVAGSTTASGSITEAANATGSSTADIASGSIAFADVDLSDTHTTSVTGVTTSGTTSGLPAPSTLLSWFSLGAETDSSNGATGTQAWNFSAKDKSFDYLAAGQTVTLTYRVQVADNHGGTTSQNVVVTVTGTNDAPTIVAGSTTATGAFSEASNTTGSTGTDSTSGSIGFADVDLSDAHTVSQAAPTFSWSGGPLSGGQISALTSASTLALTKTDSTSSGSGSVAWTYSAQDKTFDFLAAAQTLAVTYTVQVDDGHGGVVSQPVTITVTGTNDTPVITSSAQGAALTELANTTGSNSADQASGAVTFTDADLSDTHTVTITGVVASGVTSGLADNATVKSWLSLGTLSDATGGKTGSDAWSFAAADKSFDYLAAGESVTLTYTVQVDDGHGGVVSQPVTITVTGTNDTPVIVAGSTTATGAFNEAAGQTGSTATDSANGTIAIADVDLSDAHMISQGTPSFVWSGGKLTAGQQSALTSASTLTLTKTDLTGTGSGSVAWTYSAQDKTFDFLAAGQTLTVTYAVTVDDGHGGTTSQNVVVTVTGTNDQPTIVAGSTIATGAFSEASNTTGSTSTDSASGSIGFADVDLSDAHTVSQAAPTFSWSGGTLSAGQISALTSASTLALTKTDSTGTGSGSVAWTYSAQDKTFDFLAAGQTLTVTYAVAVEDGHGGTTSQNVVVTVTGTNDAPVVTDTGGSTTWTEASGTGANTPVLIDSGVTVSDVDNTTLASAKVQITGGFHSAEDVLAFTNNGSTMGNIAGSYNAGTGVLTLTSSGATATLAQWQAALDAVTYNDTSHNPNTGSRTISFTVNDGTLDSVASTKTVIITATDTAPVVTGTGGSTTWTEASGTGANTPVVIDSGVTVSDVDNTTLASAKVQITGGFHSAEDVLAFTNNGSTMGNIAGSYNAGTGVLTLTSSGATATLAQWQAALDAVTYNDTSHNPNTGSRTISFTVNDGTLDSVASTKTVIITAVDTAPVVTDSSGQTSFIKQGGNSTGPVKIDTGLTVTDADNATLASAKVQITGGFQSAEDVLAFTNNGSTMGNIAGSYNASTGVLTLTSSGATATLAQWQAALEAVTYNDTNSGNNINTGTRTISFTVNDGTLDSAVSTKQVTVAKNPAGVAGAPINLALSDPTGSNTQVTLQISNTPSDWTVSGAFKSSDGSWSMTTSDIGELTISTPSTYSGAHVVTVTETWINADGKAGTAVISDNIEAFAPGSPIFAWSGDDTLTGSSGHDTFVFSRPIGNDVLHSFEVSSDTIDLISYGWHSFSDVQAHTADDANGNAVITLAAGQTITLDGVHAADLTATNFEFDMAPTTENPGMMTVGDGAMLPLSGIIDNTGTIELQGSGDETLLQLIQTGIVLKGGGQVILSDDDHNVIAGTAPNVTLDNVDNVISGAGQIGQGSLTLSNQGTIDATGVHALVIDTGVNAMVNIGTLEATGPGGLVLDSAVANSGLIWANGGTVTAMGEVTGNGNALISGAGTIEFEAGAAAKINFDATAAGHLILDDAFHFSGTVSGLDGNDDIDIKGISFGAGTTVSFTETQAGTGGTLTVSDGAHTANIVLLGQYDPTGFTEKADTTNGTVISYDPHHIA
ncbi:beta strand repeat-containing protein [Bradyrhizobium manausense]|uniref:Cadherin domain-containing protein n=1 Tax=Bradyrhizobium manausense TaxID=989370 RepID=A0A0R3DE31_9BRAD|nr:VCBS domain-containing protein [Bradyrhizobium manausense]KRQ08298.1 hypothetical protein AOQ71_22685 [Bradyrhizobium manausense]